jgi:transcriptional regulator with XRE-family HTH domain
LQTKKQKDFDFAGKLIELQRRTNLKGAKFASELGIKPSYVSQLRNGKKMPPPQLEKLVDEKLGNVPPADGMVAVRVEIPKRLYTEARNMAQIRSFVSMDEFVAHLIRQEIERLESPIAGLAHPTAPSSFPKPPKRIADDER